MSAQARGRHLESTVLDRERCDGLYCWRACALETTFRWAITLIWLTPAWPNLPNRNEPRCSHPTALVTHRSALVLVSLRGLRPFDSGSHGVGSIGWIAGLGQAGSAAIPFMTGALAASSGIWTLHPL